MTELLKELGIVCENRRKALIIRSLLRKEEERRLWLEKIVDMNNHIEQLHNKLKNRRM